MMISSHCHVLFVENGSFVGLEDLISRLTNMLLVQSLYKAYGYFFVSRGSVLLHAAINRPFFSLAVPAQVMCDLTQQNARETTQRR